MLSLDHHHHCRQQQRYDKRLTGPKRRPTGCRLGLKYFFLVCFIYLYIFDLFTIRLRVSTGTTTATTEVWMGGEEKEGPKRRGWRRLGTRCVFLNFFSLFILHFNFFYLSFQHTNVYGFRRLVTERTDIPNT